MIPNSPFLRRHLLQSGTSEFAYDPYTLLLHDRGIDSYKTGRTVEDKALLQISTAYHSSIVHERSHWLQHNSTTICALLSLIRYVQQRTAEGMMFELPLSVRRKVAEKRVRSLKSIVPLQAVGFLDTIALEGNDLLVDPLKIQIWFDCLVVDKFLLSSESLIQSPESECLGEILADCFLYLSGELGFGEYPGNDCARSIYRPADGPCAVHSKDGVHLTTEVILESAATLNEILTWLNMAKQLPFLNTSTTDCPATRALLDTRYGRPIKWFIQLTGLFNCDIVDLAPTISLVCDLSLNPPVPPIYHSFEREIQWSEVYPPLRFVLLAKAVSSVGLLPLGQLHEVVLEFSRKLCDAAGLQHPLDFPTAFKGWAQRTDARKDMDAQWDFQGGNMSWYNIILSTNEQMWDLRMRSWPIFSNFGEATFGEFSRRNAQLLLALENEPFWYLKPLLYYSRDEKFKVSTAITKRNGELLGISVAYNQFIYDFMLGSGPFDFSPFPRNMRENVLSHMPEEFASLMGLEGEFPDIDKGSP